MLAIFIGFIACTHKKTIHKKKTTTAAKQKKPKKAVNTKKIIQNKLSANRYPKKTVRLYSMAQMHLSDNDRKRMEMLGSAAKGRQALGAILAMGDDGNRVLKKALRWTNPNGRIQAAIIASRIKHPDKDVLALMVQNLLHDPDQDCRSQTAAVFVDLHYRPAIPSLLKMLQQDPHPMARANAAWALGAFRDRKAVLPLITALNDKYTWVRLRAASALKKLADRRAIKAIKSHIKTEKNPMVKKRLRQALTACKRHK